MKVAGVSRQTTENKIIVIVFALHTNRQNIPSQGNNCTGVFLKKVAGRLFLISIDFLNFYALS